MFVYFKRSLYLKFYIAPTIRKIFTRIKIAFYIQTFIIGFTDYLQIN